MYFSLRTLPISWLKPLKESTVSGLLSGLAPGLITGLLSGLLLWSSPLATRAAIAQQISPELRQQFLSDPSTPEFRDPILPERAVERPYSPLELSAIATSLTQLNRTAQQQLANGNPDAAFELWQREARLSRIFGPIEELNTLSRVATLAWQQQRPVTVQLLTLRTREIWETVAAALNNFESNTPNADDTDAENTEQLGESDPAELADNPEQMLVAGNNTSDRTVLLNIAQTFATLRDIDAAVEVYQQLIALTTEQNGDPTAQQKELAELHLAWFQFANAADVYLALLSDARTKGNQAQETNYLERLVYSYQQADSLTNAVRAQTDLIDLYQAQGDAEKLPGLLVTIAQNYRTLNLHQSAIAYYRSAYSTAQRFDQFSFSAQVLRDLGTLYESLALNSEALGAYTLLVPVEEQAYNTYGVMNAYDSIGQLHRRQGNTFEALKAFQTALVLADQLNLRQDYFIEQIESVTP